MCIRTYKHLYLFLFCHRYSPVLNADLPTPTLPWTWAGHGSCLSHIPPLLDHKRYNNPASLMRRIQTGLQFHKDKRIISHHSGLSFRTLPNTLWSLVAPQCCDTFHQFGWKILYNFKRQAKCISRKTQNCDPRSSNQKEKEGQKTAGYPNLSLSNSALLNVVIYRAEWNEFGEFFFSPLPLYAEVVALKQKDNPKN